MQKWMKKKGSCAHTILSHFRAAKMDESLDYITNVTIAIIICKMKTIIL